MVVLYCTGLLNDETLMMRGFWLGWCEEQRTLGCGFDALLRGRIVARLSVIMSPVQCSTVQYLLDEIGSSVIEVQYETRGRLSCTALVLYGGW